MEVISQVYEGNQSYDLTLKVNDDSRKSAERIKNLIIDANGRKYFGKYCEYLVCNRAEYINRENVSRKIVISANVTGGDLRGAVNEIQQKIDREIELPAGYHIEYGGQFESEQSASRTLLITSFSLFWRFFCYYLISSGASLSRQLFYSTCHWRSLVEFLPCSSRVEISVFRPSSVLFRFSGLPREMACC